MIHELLKLCNALFRVRHADLWMFVAILEMPSRD